MLISSYDMPSSSSSSSEGWEDIEPEGQDDLQVVCLQNDAKFPTVELLLAHCKKEHQFDLNGLRSALRMQSAFFLWDHNIIDRYFGQISTSTGR